MTRITLTLGEEEKEALLMLATREFRDPRMQASLIIRNELERRGLIQNALSQPNHIDNLPGPGKPAVEITKKG